MENWLKQNALGLVMGAVALVGAYTKLSADLRVIQSDVANQSEYAERVQQNERDLLELQARQAASKDYMSRFEAVLTDNTRALNLVNNTLSKYEVITEDQNRRIINLENRE
jgi:septal ring factor EnvC (AmiA/AmiB activator)